MHRRNRVALITGGSRGIGLGIAQALAGDGWDLAINGMRPEAKVAGVLEQLRQTGRRIAYCQGDVSKTDDRDAILSQVRTHFGRLHLLVNNAGITSPGRKDILEATEDAFDRVMGVNFTGAVFLTQAAARWMIDQRRSDTESSGYIVNISSVSGQTSSVNRGDYCISWACLSKSTELFAESLFQHGINVYEVRPGIIRTDMTKGATEKYDRLIADGLTIEPRWGTPEDVGRAVAMLVRGELTYATGTVLNVDGGLSVLQNLASA